MTEELLKLQTYGRLFQRLASTKQLVPLGIYRTVPVASCPEISVRENIKFPEIFAMNTKKYVEWSLQFLPLVSFSFPGTAIQLQSCRI